MKLRKWQIECINKALLHYERGEEHFLVLATPGSGKTIMASELANKLFKRNQIDLVFCFSPSTIVSSDFGDCLNKSTNFRFDGLIGARGNSLTYQNLQYLNKEFWQLFKNYNVFVIFDEIHHCSGSNIYNSNVWGKYLLTKIKNKAKFSLSLTGTPWRSDSVPIALSKYDLDEKIVCNYTYGISKAISDGVCRLPKIVAVDNTNIIVREDEKTSKYKGFAELLSKTKISYQSIIENDGVIKYFVSTANKELTNIRNQNPKAAGLIVASSVEHAKFISNLMANDFNEKATIVTYKEKEPSKKIQNFRESNSKWIISVGMISEGTNIPRLQVCCHLTNIKTEMYFRQILGRILRNTNTENEQAIIYIPAEPKLLNHAYRIQEDIPTEKSIIHFDKVPHEINTSQVIKVLNKELVSTRIGKPLHSMYPESECSISKAQSENLLINQCVTQSVGIFGKFKEEAVSLGLSDLK